MTTEYEHLSAEERGAIMATLVTHLGLQQELAPHLLSMAQQCFGWASRRLQVKVPVSDWHSLLVHIKNAAYAWRQMVFFLALLEQQCAVSGDCSDDFMCWAHQQLSAQPAEFAARFRPALVGLEQAASGRVGEGGQVFLGWVQGRHWLW